MMRQQRRNRLKFFAILMFHLGLAGILYFLSGDAFIRCADPGLCLSINLLIHGGFAILYFLLIWKPLYANNYLYLLQKGILKLIFKNLLLAAAAVLILFFVLYLGINFFAEIRAVNRNLPGIFALLLLDLVVFCVLHLLQLCWIWYLTRLGHLQRNVLLVGEPDRRFSVTTLFDAPLKTRLYAGQLIFREAAWYLSIPEQPEQCVPAAELAELLYRLQIGEVIIFICHSLREEHLGWFTRFCHDNSIDYSLVPDIRKIPELTYSYNPFSYIPLITHFTTNRDSLVLLSCKRLLDLVLAALLLLGSLPLFLLIALAIKLEDGGTVLHISRRVGKNGKVIDFYKFRSMVLQAEVLLDDLWQYNLRPDGPLFKMHNDPRSTRVGRIIRKCGLDELPQLLNVLKGDLSMVGPRPHLVQEVQAYKGKDFLRLECIPGMTCLPQLYDHARIGFRRWVDLDLDYRHNWSLFLDMKILLRSIGIIIGLSKGYLIKCIKVVRGKQQFTPGKV